MGCGLAPGLVGVLVMRGVNRLAEATAARSRVGDVPDMGVSWTALSYAILWEDQRGHRE